MKALTRKSFLARVLGKLADGVMLYPRRYFYPQLVLFGLCIFFTVTCLQFDMDRDHLVGSNQTYQKNYLTFRKEFPQPDDLVVVVQSDDLEKNRQFIERIGAKMKAYTNLFEDVFYKTGDLSSFGKKALLLGSADDLHELQNKLNDEMPFIEKFTATTNLVSFFEQINTAFRTSPRTENAQTTSLIDMLPALQQIISQADKDLYRLGTPPSPGVMTLFDPSAVTSNYITFANGTIFLATAHAPNDAINGDSVQKLKELVAETKAEIPGVNAGLTGQPVLDYDEMVQSQKDMTLASVVSLILCALIFIYGYAETGRPVKATICLIVGMAYTLAWATLAIGHLNILTITFVPILIGLAIDYGVHLVTRYEEELRCGRTKESAIKTAMVCTGQGIFTGALTTAGAFIAMAFTSFKGIQEMGIICGGGLLLCFIPMMTLLPMLLLRGRQNVLDIKLSAMKRREQIENIWLQRPIAVTAVTVALCAAAATQIPKVHFDYNLLHLQANDLPSVIYEQKLLNSAGKSVLFGAVVANSLDDALKLETQLRQLTNVVSDVQSAATFMAGTNTPAKLKLIGEIKKTVAPLKFYPPDTEPVNITSLSTTLYSLYGYLGDALEEVGNGQPKLSENLISLRNAIENFRKDMLAGSPEDVAAHAKKLEEFQVAFLDDIRNTFQALQNQDDSGPLRPADLPKVLHDRFIGVTGKYLLQVYPVKDLNDRANQKEFLDEVRKVVPNVTGTPVQLYEYTDLLKNSYIEAAWYSLIAIIIMVFFHFRSLMAIVLSLIPVGIGALWLIGLMGAFGTQFNPANIMTLPLVIGIGVTNGVNILNRYAEEGTPSILTRSTGKAVLVSGLTAISGFGSLILAKDQGIHSLGCVMAVGIATCMIAGLTFLPALLNLIGKHYMLIKQPSADKSPTPGQEEPR
jgi:hopanoid biosynthesis associated RND transporter like protein HpnN